MVFALLLLCVFVLLRSLKRRRTQRGAARRAPGAAGHRFIPAPPRRSLRCRKPAWVRREIVRLAAETAAGCRTLAMTFNRLHAASTGVTVGKTFVSAVLRRHRYALEVQRRMGKHRIPEAQPRNRRWGVDMTGKQDLEGKVHALFGIVDHGSRRALALVRLERRNALTLLGHLCLAMGRFGPPRFIHTDNEAVFRSRLFRGALAVLGVRQQFSKPGQPWMNGRVERFFGTLKAKLDAIVPIDGSALALLLGEFCLWYNHVRPHQHLGGRTPVEAWEGIDPYRAPPKEVMPFSAWGGRLRGYYLRR